MQEQKPSFCTKENNKKYDTYFDELKAKIAQEMEKPVAERFSWSSKVSSMKKYE